MKKTEEINENDILIIISKEDAKEFKALASGRKFCKRGERISDICSEEFERKEYKKLSLFSRIFHKKKFRKSELLIESRLPSTARRVASYILSKEENNNISEKELEEKTKQFILEKVDKYLEEKVA